MLGAVETERGRFFTACWTSELGVGAIAHETVPTFGASAAVKTGLRRALLRLDVAQGTDGSCGD